MKRRTLLDDYINPFLRSIGMEPWNMRTPLYHNWFLGEKVGCSDNDKKRGGTLPLVVRHSSFQIIRDLEQFVAQLKAGQPLPSPNPKRSKSTASNVINSDLIPEIELRIEPKEPQQFRSSDPIRIGRDAQAHVVCLEDTRISKQQGCIQWEPKLQSYQYHHLGRNPSVVDSHTLKDAGSMARLQNESIIEIGGTTRISVRILQQAELQNGDTDVD